MCTDGILYNRKTQKHQQQRRLGTIYICIVYFMLYSTFVIFLLYYLVIFPIVVLSTIVIRKQWFSTEFATITQYISRKIRKGKVLLIWFSCYVVSNLSSFIYLSYGQPFIPLFYSFLIDITRFHSYLFFVCDFFNNWKLQGNLLFRNELIAGVIFYWVNYGYIW